jgi:putative MATE family efflux protein
MTQMLGVGTTTVVSHASGRKDREDAQHLFNQSQALSCVVGALFLVVAMAGRMAYARAMGADVQTTTAAGQYLMWFIPAMALQFPFASMGAALRGTGNFKPGMIVASGTVIMNMILAPFLIFGWVTGRAYGVAGAAMSTLISIVIGIVWMTTYFTSKDAFLHFSFSHWTPHLGQWKKILSIGLPAGFEFAMMAVYQFIVYTVARPFGAAAQAGFGIGMRVIQAGFMPVVALGFSVAPVAGQNFGAKLAERVKATFRDGVRLALAWQIFFIIVVQFAAAGMVRVFSKDPAVIAVGDDYLKIISWSFIASGPLFVTSSMFQAMGNTMPSLIASGTRMVILVIPVFSLSRLPTFDLHWVWWLSLTTAYLQLGLALWMLRGEFAKRLRFGVVAPPDVGLNAPIAETVRQ